MSNMEVQQQPAKPGHNLITGTVTGASSPTAAKQVLGNVFHKYQSGMVAFLCGAAVMGVLILAYTFPLLLQAYRNEMAAKYNLAVQDAKIAREDATDALNRVRVLEKVNERR